MQALLGTDGVARAHNFQDNCALRALSTALTLRPRAILMQFTVVAEQARRMQPFGSDSGGTRARSYHWYNRQDSGPDMAHTALHTAPDSTH